MTSTADSLRVKLGQRIVEPAFPIVDDRPPSAIDLARDSPLRTYMETTYPTESEDNLRRKERVLATLSDVFQSWVTEVCLAKGYPLEVATSAGAVLKTSGSYRLGIHDRNADIDTVCVAPSMCNREDFFSTLAAKLEAMRSLTELRKVEAATVPIMNFKLDGVEIDLLFAQLKVQSIPRNFDIDDDNVLIGVDVATEKSLNGPRVTNLISRLVSGTPQRMQAFIQVVRCVRQWAKARGLYGNALGYLGGINFNLMVTMVLQLYPNSSPSALLRRFFFVFNSWRWPNPVLLCPSYDAKQEDTLGGTKIVCTGGQQPDRTGRVMRQIMPIVTPAYPAMNSSLSVSKQTLQVMQAEIVRAHNIVERICKDPASISSANADGHAWAELFEPSDFFIDYPHYLAIVIVGPNAKDFEAWKGFVDSRLRFLVSDNLGASLPLSKIQLWPKTFDGKDGRCYADKSSMLTDKQRYNSSTYFIGFQIDKFRMRGDELNVEKQIQNFKTSTLSKSRNFVPGCDLVTRYFSVKELPPAVFESTYKVGGKEEAMAKRLARRLAVKAASLPPPDAASGTEDMATDAGQEASDAGLKGVEAEAGDETGEQAEGDGMYEGGGEGAELVPAAVTSGGADDEATRLERALDGMNQGAMKTKEEAERERQMLLEGEFLGEDNEDNEEANTEILARAGFNVGDGEEVELKIDVPVWRLPPQKRAAGALEGGGVGGAGQAAARVKLEEGIDEDNRLPKVAFVFKTVFENVVALDADGAVVDMGDENYKPCKKFSGKMSGFEFKLGERGLGYYRTGVKVVVPANVL